MCKHLILVYLKVLRLSMDDPVLPQKGLLQSELARIFARLPGGGREKEEKDLQDVLANAEARAAYAAQVGGGVHEEQEEKEGQEGGKKGQQALDLAGEDECPVCLEEFNTRKPEDVVICYTCHKPIHVLCHRTWNGVKIAEGGPRSCVWCRAPWVDPAVAGAAAAKGKKGTSSARGEGLMQGLAVKDGGYMNVAALTGQQQERDVSTYNVWGMLRCSEYGGCG